MVWTSSNTAVATVDSTGRVAGIAAGSSVITATLDGVSGTTNVTVLAGPPSPQINGDWTMTLSPSPSCRDQFPEYARERNYTLHFTQDRGDFRLTITAPTLEVANPNENGGQVVGSHIVFGFIGDTSYPTFSSTDLHDHLSSTEILDFSGIVTGTIAGSEVHAVMSGEVNYWNAAASLAGPTVICRATDHVVTLRR